MIPEEYQSIVPFGVLAVNTIIFGMLRGCVGRPADPNELQWFLLEFLATLEFCADCAELDIIFEMHGIHIAGVTLFILCFLWAQMWFKVTANPCDVLEDLIWRDNTVTKCSARFLGQLLGTVLSRRYALVIWSWDLMHQHKKARSAKCSSVLHVETRTGFAIEATIAMISLFVEVETWNMVGIYRNAINAAIAVLLVLAALSSTGGYFNPAVASAMIFNCSGITHKEFFVVYWLGPIIGRLIATVFHCFIHRHDGHASSSAASHGSDHSSRSAGSSRRSK